MRSTAPPAASHPEEPKPLYAKLLKFLCGHVGLFLLVCAVAVAGAFMFIAVEKGGEEQRFLLKRSKARDMEDGYNYFVQYWWHYAAKPNLTYLEWDKKVKSHLKVAEQFIIDAVDQYGYDGTVEGWTYDWTLSKALLYSITIMTTIGYGHVFPQTLRGQMLTIMYALVATPMMLVFLANIGDVMARCLRYTYSRCCCRWCRSVRYKSESIPGRKVKRIYDDNVGKERYMPTDEVQIPIVVILMLITLYLMVGAMIFSEWEGWSLSSAYYFSFVTLSTIGFGDMVPGNSFIDRKDQGFISSLKMGTTILYCVLGMALISMCIQVMQEQVLSKVRWFVKEVGLAQNNDKRPRVRVKKTKYGTTPETMVKSAPRPETSERERRRKMNQEKREINSAASSAKKQPPVQATSSTDKIMSDSESDSDSYTDLFNLA